MSYKPGDAYFKEFVTSNPTTQAAANADALPVATANRGGADDAGFVLTVTNIDTGRYKITGTIPSGYGKGDVVNITIAATCGGVAGKALAETFILDSKRVGDLNDYAGGDTPGTTTLLGRLTAARGGYLDNLNVGGPVASHADFLAINQSATKHLILTTVQQYAPGETYTVEMRTFAAADGSAVNADTTPTLTATGTVSGSLAANLSAATNPATGVYRWTYTPGSAPTLEQIRFDGSATIAAATFTLSAYSQTVDAPTATFTGTDKANLTAIFNKLPAGNIADETILLTAIGTPAQAAQIPSHFTNATFASDGVFSVAALANAPAGGGGGGGATLGEIEALLPTNFAAMEISPGGLVAFDGTRQPAVRNQDAVAAPTYDDCFVGAWVEAYDKETLNATARTYAKQKPDNSGPIRTFSVTFDTNGNPIARA